MFVLMYDVIDRKRNGQAITEHEIKFLVDGFTAGEIPDYQMSAFLMAVCINGMTPQETTWLTKAMVESGDTVDLSSIPGIKVDKHSTGGVGDKTTLIVAPMVASCGVPVAKMSGRGLGHTGGTIDKLESIPGFNTAISMQQFIQNVNSINLSVVDKVGNIAPADKKIYALRDVTATVSSLPLIASSIMSKKIASGADKIVLDVKYGSGAFMKTAEEATELAKEMCEIGRLAGKGTAALVTNMDVPLGRNIGNFLEVKECIKVLSGETTGLEDLVEVCISLATHMLFLAEKGSLNHCQHLAQDSLENGCALAKFKEFVECQGGRWADIEGDKNPYMNEFSVDFCASQDGYIYRMDVQTVGLASVELGAGRQTKDSIIDFGAGIELFKKTGDWVSKGEPLGKLFSQDLNKITVASQMLEQAYHYSALAPAKNQLIEAIITDKY